jgi:arabinofuranosyltransferase
MRRSWILPAAISAVFSVVFIYRNAFFIGGHRYFTLFDDAMISMRYARNFAQGYGLVSNPGHSADEGYTKYLWTLCMAAMHLLPLPESKMAFAVSLLGAAILVLNIRVIGRITVTLSQSQGAALVAMLLAAICYPLVYWTLRGMEVGFLALIVSTAAYQSIRVGLEFSWRRILILILLAGAAILTRTDGIVPFVAIGLFLFFGAPREKRIQAALVFAAGALAFFAAHTAFRINYYGDALPNTFYLKMGGVSLLDRVARGASSLEALVVRGLWIPISLGAVATIKRRDRITLLLAGIFLAQCAFSVYVGGDAWEWMPYANRYISIAMPQLIVLAVLGAYELYRMPRESLAETVKWIAIAVALFSMVRSIDLLSTKSVNPTILGRYSPTRAVIIVFLVLVSASLIRLRSNVGQIMAVRGKLLSMIGLIALIASIAYPIGGWIRHGAAHADDDATMTRAGVAVRNATSERATIAVVWAGAIPYFAHRTTIDLLGKNDVRIAHEQPRTVFFPGHNKWDYDYSIGELKPDIVLQLWKPTERDFAMIDSAGYDRLDPVRWKGVYIRRAAAVDRDRLRNNLISIGW